MFGFLNKLMPAKSTKRASAPKTEKAPVKRVRKVQVKHVSSEEDAGKPEKVVTFEKKKVHKILDGGHTKTHFHCEMEGGVTMHVPKRLFE